MASTSATTPDLFASVVVPVYNGADTLAACLAGLDCQTVPRGRYEVIIVDDGSTDDSAAIAARSGARVIRRAHRGAGAARNAGIAAARGDLVLFTDADCVPAPDWIEQLVAKFADPATAGARGVYRTHQRGLIPRFVQLEYLDRYDRTLRQPSIDFVDTYAAAYRRDVLVAAGGFDEALMEAEDMDLSYRLASRGYRMVFAPRAIVYHRHPGTLLGYLRRKALYGYWRVPIYARYPSKMGGDSHTPVVLRWQMGLVAAMVGLAPIAILEAGLWWVWAGLAGAFCVSTLPFCIKALRRDAPVTPVVLPFLWARALAIGAGLALGAVRLAQARVRGRVARRQQFDSSVGK